MSDAITDIERENNENRLNKLDPNKLARELRTKAREIAELKNDLELLGFTVERNGDKYKIFKEI